MGIISSLTYNRILAKEVRGVIAMQSETLEAVPASGLRAGDQLANLEGQAWTITEVRPTTRRVAGLGLLRFGMANDKVYRAVGRSERGEVRPFEFPSSYLVLRVKDQPG